VDVITTESVTFIQALSSFCELEMDNRRTDLRSTEVSVDGDENAVVISPQMPELVSFYLFHFYIPVLLFFCGILNEGTMLQS